MSMIDRFEDSVLSQIYTPLCLFWLRALVQAAVVMPSIQCEYQIAVYFEGSDVYLVNCSYGGFKDAFRGERSVPTFLISVFCAAA